MAHISGGKSDFNKALKQWNRVRESSGAKLAGGWGIYRVSRYNPDGTVAKLGALIQTIHGEREQAEIRAQQIRNRDHINCMVVEDVYSI